MLISNQPPKVSVPFANSGGKQPIPVASQIGIEDGRASFTDGFPPLTRTPLSAGGKPPFGTDMNGILYAITQIQQWQSAGGGFSYDSAFATAIGGYPKGAKLVSADSRSMWVSTIDSNVSNPDTGGAGWAPLSPAGVVGQARDIVMSVPSASASATMTASELTLESRLGGLRYGLISFSKTINLGTTGAGGMDAGAAPASGFVAVYAIYNPATDTSALLGVDATAAVAPNVYGGTNMPAGFTASALVSVWPTTSGRLFQIGYQEDRDVSFPFAVAAATSAAISTPTPISISAIVPKNAKSILGWLSCSGVNTSNLAISIFSSTTGIGFQQVAGNSTSSTISNITTGSFSGLKLITQQVIYWTATLLSGTFSSASVNISGYRF